jgi:carbon-monoxide dehydrogenase medium subunit
MFENVETFCRPASVREALQLLHDAKGSARIIAGCTDLIVEGDRSVRCLIDLHHAGLSYIRRRGPNWAIGSTTTMAEIEESRVMHVLAGGLLSRAAATCGAIQIRNMATIGGNMANGSPSADLATPLLALDAWAVVADLTRRRRTPLAEYLPVARGREMHNSLLVEVAFPEPPHGSRCAWSFQKFGRTEVDISLVNVAAGLQLDARGRVKWARLALGAVAPTPIRIAAAEQLLTGRILDQALLTEVCELVMREVSPISDIRASADYRRELSRVLTGRAIEECAAHAGWSL